jgi:serine/threonine protein kinase
MAAPSVKASAASSGKDSAASRTTSVHQNKNVYELLSKNINQGKSNTTRVYKRKRNEKLFVSTNRPYGDKAGHEIEILTALAGLPGIIPLEDFEEYSKENGKFIKIYTPYKKNDLYHFVDNKISVIPKKILLDIFKQIIETVISMHKKRICHLDLKLENIVIDNENKIYIIDFESAAEVDENGFFKEKIFGTQGYIPLDLISYAKLNKNHTALINGCAMDMYAVCTIMIKSWKHQYGVNNTTEMIKIFKNFRDRCNQANPHSNFQEELLETIEALLLMKNNELQNSKKGGYKKPRRTIHKQYTRKRHSIPSYKKSYRF